MATYPQTQGQTAPSPKRLVSSWSPLRHEVFAAIWTATLFSKHRHLDVLGRLLLAHDQSQLNAAHGLACTGGDVDVLSATAIEDSEVVLAEAA